MCKYYRGDTGAVDRSGTIAVLGQRRRIAAAFDARDAVSGYAADCADIATGSLRRRYSGATSRRSTFTPLGRCKSSPRWYDVGPPGGAESDSDSHRRNHWPVYSVAEVGGLVLFMAGTDFTRHR